MDKNRSVSNDRSGMVKNSFFNACLGLVKHRSVLISVLKALKEELYLTAVWDSFQTGQFFNARLGIVKNRSVFNARLGVAKNRSVFNARLGIVKKNLF